MIHSKTVINRIGSGKIIINGKSHIIGNASMEIDGNGNVFVNGKPLQDYEANYTEPPVLKIEITGTVQHIETENADIQVNGNVGEVVSKNGNVSCQTVEGSVTSKNGNVSCSVIKGGLRYQERQHYAWLLTGGQEMKQSTKADEVRALLAALDRQLTKEGFFLHNVRFNRENDTDSPHIVLSYEERGSDTDKSDSNEADK